MTVANTIGKALAKIPPGQMVAVAAGGSGTIGLAVAGPPIAVVAVVGLVAVAAVAGCYAIYSARSDKGSEPYPPPPLQPDPREPGEVPEEGSIFRIGRIKFLLRRDTAPLS